MKTTKLAAVAFALGGALVFDQNVAFAKGPLDIEAGSRLILVKETPTEIDLKDFPFDLEEGVTKNVRMSFEQELSFPEEETEKISYVVTMPMLEVEKDGDDKVKIIFPENYSVTMVMGPQSEQVQLDINGVSENQVMTFERNDGRMAFSGVSDAFAMSITSPQATENGVDFKFKMSGKGLDINGRGAAEQDWNDIQNLDISYDYTMDEILYDAIATNEEDGQQFELTGTAAKILASGQIGQGRIEGITAANDMAINIAKPLPIAASIGRLTSEILMPTDPSPKPQDIKYLIGAEKIVLDDFIWEMMDPAGAFKRELNKIVIDMEMQAMLTASFLDPEAMAEIEATGVPPLLPLGAKINSIAFDGLGLVLDASGEGKMNGVQPEGKAFISLKGLSGFVAGAQKAGLLADQQAIIIEGMAGQLGKEGDDGELIFDIKTDSGMININGAPIMPIPGVPQ